MGNTDEIELENLLQNTYWKYVVERSKEYVKFDLTGRLVIDFQKGTINSIQDQQIVAGTSALIFGLQKITV